VNFSYCDDEGQDGLDAGWGWDGEEGQRGAGEQLFCKEGQKMQPERRRWPPRRGGLPFPLRLRSDASKSVTNPPQKKGRHSA